MPKRRFVIFHLSLVPVREPRFETVQTSREQWLRSRLSEAFEFAHRAGRSLHWVPRDDIDECVFGVIQQQKPHIHHLPPDAGGRETVSDEWQGAYVLLDPTSHEEGQRIAVEIDNVGVPSALLKSMLGHINSDELRPFTIEFKPVFDGRSFWSFSERHSNVLRYVAFDFVVPNMWGAESELEKDLKSTGEQTGAEHVQVRIEAKDGISTENQKISDGVSYAEKGAGRITAKSLDGRAFSSENRPRTTDVPDVSEEDADTREQISRNKNRVLGRDEG